MDPKFRMSRLHVTREIRWQVEDSGGFSRNCCENSLPDAQGSVTIGEDSFGVQSWVPVAVTVFVSRSFLSPLLLTTPLSLVWGNVPIPLSSLQSLILLVISGLAISLATVISSKMGP